MLSLYLGHLWSHEELILFKNEDEQEKNQQSTVNMMIFSSRNWLREFFGQNNFDMDEEEMEVGKNWWGSKRDLAEKERKFRDSLRLCLK